MQVVLLERIRKLGHMGDVVTVKDGYARNFLLPQGKALRANKANLERFEQNRSQLEASNLELKKDADSVATKIDGSNFTIIRQAGDTGQLYGSVSTRDVAANVTENGYDVVRRQILLDRPIKILGLHAVRISLHPEVEVGITINVARSEEEAERQARGEDVMANDDDFDDEDTIAVEDVFEDEELAKEAEGTLSDEESADTEQQMMSAESTAEEDASDDAANNDNHAPGSDGKES